MGLHSVGHRGGGHGRGSSGLVPTPSASRTGSEDFVQVRVRSLAGEILATLCLPAGASVREAKLSLVSTLGIQLFCQQLVFGSAVIENDKILGDFGQHMAVTLVVLPLDRSRGYCLLEAAARGKVEEAETVLRERADLNHTDGDCKTPLFMAARRGHLEMVRFLCEVGSDQNIATKAGRTPLHIAALQGNVDVVHELYKGGACMDKVIGQGHTPIYIGAQQGHLEVIRYLCEIRADMQKAGKSGNLPLHIAARQGHFEVVRHLCEAGVDKDSAMENGNTSLHICARQGHIAVARYLCQARADIDRAINNCITPLYAASREGHIDVVRCLCEAGADRDRVDERRRTPARIGAQHGHVEVVRYLCEEAMQAQAHRFPQHQQPQPPVVTSGSAFSSKGRRPQGLHTKRPLPPPADPAWLLAENTGATDSLLRTASMASAGTRHGRAGELLGDALEVALPPQHFPSGAGGDPDLRPNSAAVRIPEGLDGTEPPRPPTAEPTFGASAGSRLRDNTSRQGAARVVTKTSAITPELGLTGTEPPDWLPDDRLQDSLAKRSPWRTTSRGVGSNAGAPNFGSKAADLQRKIFRGSSRPGSASRHARAIAPADAREVSAAGRGFVVAWRTTAA